MPVSTTMRHMQNNTVIMLCDAYSPLIYQTPQVRTVRLFINITGEYNLITYQTTHIFNSVHECKVTKHFSDGKVGKKFLPFICANKVTPCQWNLKVQHYPRWP
jgi:predicted HAD superfamily Cof-like phosphohydrolase